MYTALRALAFGEDFTSDPVSKILGYGLRYFSRGAVAINVQLISQVRSSVHKFTNVYTEYSKLHAYQHFGMPEQT